MGRNCFTTTWSSVVVCAGATIQTGYGTYGQFQQPGRGFIAFSFDTGAGLQFGWARIKTSGIPLVNFILVDYAWGDPGDYYRNRSDIEQRKAASGDEIRLARLTRDRCAGIKSLASAKTAGCFRSNGVGINRGPEAGSVADSQRDLLRSSVL